MCAVVDVSVDVEVEGANNNPKDKIPRKRKSQNRAHRSFASHCAHTLEYARSLFSTERTSAILMLMEMASGDFFWHKTFAQSSDGD